MCNLREAQILPSECVLLHQNKISLILNMLYNVMRCIPSFKMTSQKEDVGARFELAQYVYMPYTTMCIEYICVCTCVN